MLSDYGRMLDLVVEEGQRLLAGARSAEPDARVPGASGRTVRETLRHVDGEYWQALAQLRGESSGRASTSAPEEHTHRASGCANARQCAAECAFPNVTRASRTVAGTMAALLAELGTRSPTEPCRTWSGEGTVGFWHRRMLHETTLHRVDVQAAGGFSADPVQDDVALDGVDEAVRLWFGRRLRALGITARHPCTVEIVTGGCGWHAVATADGDTTGNVMSDPRTAETSGVDVDVAALIPRPRAPVDDPEPAVPGGQAAPFPQARITGDPPSVYLWLWGRLPDRAVGTEGDPDAIAQLWGLLRMAMH